MARGARLRELGTEHKFRHVVRHTANNRFELNLDEAQVHQLVRLFLAGAGEALASSSSSASGGALQPWRT